MFLPPRNKNLNIFLLSDCFSLSISYSHEKEIKKKIHLSLDFFSCQKNRIFRRKKKFLDVFFC